MFIVCPKCSVKYQIPPEITLKEGQKLQCSACQHIFLFQPTKETIVNESFVSGLQIPEDPVLEQEKTAVLKEEINDSVELPTAFKPFKQEPTKSTPHMGLWLILILCLFLVAGIWFFRDILKTDYTINSRRPIHSLIRTKNLQETPSQKVVSEDIIDIPLFVEKQSNAVQSDNFRFHSVRYRLEGTELLIEGIIHNNTDVPQVVPDAIYATAYNQQGQVLFTKEIFLSNDVLQPYGQKAFFGTYSPAPDGVQWIDISCKN